MTQPMVIFSGADDKAKEAYDAQQMHELYSMRLGFGTRRIYLNGGSDTRRAAAEYWQEWAEAAGVPFARCGWCVILGRDALAQHNGDGE